LALENRQNITKSTQGTGRYDRGDRAVVVDVREVDEFAAGHIPGSINMPLSTFQPGRLPDSGQATGAHLSGRQAFGHGARQMRAAQASVDTHLAGGFGAWIAAGLPVDR
jgi:rhodanese-related sulfurtransferase